PPTSPDLGGSHRHLAPHHGRLRRCRVRSWYATADQLESGEANLGPAGGNARFGTNHADAVPGFIPRSQTLLPRYCRPVGPGSINNASCPYRRAYDGGLGDRTLRCLGIRDRGSTWARRASVRDLYRDSDLSRYFLWRESG